MKKLLEIAELGAPVLRRRAQEVDNFNDDVFMLIENMKFTVAQVDGVGLAAPQVFKSKRIFIIASQPNERYPHAPIIKPTAVINPIIKFMSEEKVKEWEGCLSIPGIRGLVPRSKKVSIEYENLDGELIQKVFTDFAARIIQHEFDHLEGIVFLDRLESNKDLVTEREYQKIITAK